MDLESPGGNNSPGISNGRQSHTTEIGSKCVRCGDLAPSLLRLDRLVYLRGLPCFGPCV